MSNRRPIIHVSEPKWGDDPDHYGDLDPDFDRERFEDVRRSDQRVAVALMALVVFCVLFVIAVPILIVRSLR